MILTFQDKITRRSTATSVLAFLLISLFFFAVSPSVTVAGLIQEHKPPLPAGWENRSIELDYNLKYLNQSNTGNHTILYINLKDALNNQTLKAVTYSIRVSTDQSGTRSLLAETFFSSGGPIMIDFMHDASLSSNIIVAEKDQFLDMWSTNNDDTVIIKTPFLNEGQQYFLHLEILGAESRTTFFPDELIPKFSLILGGQDVMQTVPIPEFPALYILLAATLSVIIVIGRRFTRLSK